jgi:hypothetical protein
MTWRRRSKASIVSDTPGEVGERHEARQEDGAKLRVVRNGSAWRWSGPVAFRKHTPGLTDRGVRGPPGGRLGRMMNQLSDAEKTIDGICGSVQCG